MAVNPFEALGLIAKSTQDPLYIDNLRNKQIEQGITQRETGLREQELKMRQEERARLIGEANRQRQMEEQRRQVLGTLAPQLSQSLNVPQDVIGNLINTGVDLNTLGTINSLVNPEPSEFDQRMQTLRYVSQLPPNMQEMYGKFYGKGGTTVNVGGQQSPFTEKFEESLGSSLGKRVGELETEASDFITQANSAQQALQILQSNPDIDISPTSKISTQAKSLFAPFLSEEQLKSVADYQTLESQLIRNRFDVTKVLKGAITEQEQAAAQQVAGSATGTRQGLTQTLGNNIAYATLEADMRQRKADYIKRVGRNYSEKDFNEYYKMLGETGQRPTLDSLLSDVIQPAQSQIKFLGFE